MHHRLLYALALAALPLLASAALAPAPTAAAPTPAAQAKLAAPLREIAASAGTARGRALQTRALAAQAQPYGPAPLAARFNGAGQVQVYLHYDPRRGAPAAAALQALGATRIVPSAPLAVVQAWLPPGALYAAAALPQVTRVTIPRYAVVRRSLPPLGARPRTGSVTTQGDAILGSAQFRQTTGLDGSGVPVAIISDGVGTVTGTTSSDITQDQSTGDLPTNPAPYIDTSVNGGGSGHEGTAMLEIVYDMAPGAALGFCGPATTVDFVQCLTDFGQGRGGYQPRLVADDLGFPGVALFTDGSFATAVKNFAIAHSGIQLLTAAGNDAQQFWSGTWNPATVNTTISPSPTSTVNAYTYTQVQNLGTAGNPLDSFSFPVAAGDTVTYIVQWDDLWPVPLTATTPNDPNDYDVFLTNAANGDILACNMGINLGPAASSTAPPSPSYCDLGSNPGTLTSPGPQPVQGNQYTNNTGSTQNLHLAIYHRFGTPGIHLKVLVFANHHSFLLIPNTPAGSIYGQSALPPPYEITTTAVSAAQATSSAGYPIEPYASQGPVLFSQPATGVTTRAKPDFTAVDCVDVTGVGGFGQNNHTTPPSATFCGTSATPEATAAILALLEGAFPGQNGYSMLKAGALALSNSAGNGSGTPNGVYGWGLVNAYNSAAAVAPKPLATISAPAGNVSLQPGGTVGFSGSCSANGAPGSTSLSWNFGSGASPGTSTSASVTVTYASAGTYTATLTCTNSAFNTTATATRTVSVTLPPAPPPAAGGGGGALGPAALGALLVLAAAEARRRRRHGARGG